MGGWMLGECTFSSIGNLRLVGWVFTDETELGFGQD